MRYFETIAAIATPPGKGGVGIIRVSGINCKQILLDILKKEISPRQAVFAKFFAGDQTVIDEGIVLYFPAPHSFTGEDVIEFHAHGSPVILDYLLEEILSHGARIARPGEFSERAFLNGKLDLVQAEAIADLIDSGSRQAARAAISSLQGTFSEKIRELLTALIQLRMYVEAAIDFPEEEIDFLNDGKIRDQLETLQYATETVLKTARQGRVLREGLTIAIVGKPNAGKSSLLNQLTGTHSAIVTEIPGTTRDILREFIQLDGLPLHIMDTAGLRETDDIVEKEGVNRAKELISQVDHILLVIDGNNSSQQKIDFNDYPEISDKEKVTVIKNKIDLTQETPAIVIENDYTMVTLSAKLGTGMDLLRRYLKSMLNFSEEFEGNFIARRRHLDALIRAKKAIQKGAKQLTEHKAGELLAEDLRQAQIALAEITGEFTSDDLLGVIFSSFCIGK